MANFSDSEIQSVVERLVRATIRRPVDTLGVRRTDVAFNDIQEAAAGVFLLFPKTPYYLAYLAKVRLDEELAALLTDIAALKENVGLLRRRVLPVKDLSALVNAKVALGELEGVVSSEKAPTDLSRVPSYVRFNANVDRFIAKVGSNIKSGGKVVATPQEARQLIPGQVSGLKTGIEGAFERVDYLANALKDYGSLGLSRLLAKGVVQRARQVIDTRADQLEGMGQEGRLEVLRETVLELLSVKAVVKKFGAFASPSSSALLTGTGTPFSDTTRPANEAYLPSEKYGPYTLVQGVDAASSSNLLQLWRDGAASYPSAPSVQLFLPPSVYPKIEGVQAGPFNIQALINETLRVVVDGTTVDIALTVGTTQTAADLAADITTALTVYNYKGEPYFSPLMFDGEVVVSGGNTLALARGGFLSESVQVGDEVDFYYGANAGVTRTVTAVLPSSVAPTSIVVDGAALTTGASRIRYGSSNRRVRIVPIDRDLAVTSRSSIQVKMPDTVTRNAGITLGIFGELYGRGEPTDAEVLVDYINKGSAKVRAELNSLVHREGLNFRTEVTDGFTLVGYTHRGEASWSAGTAVTMTFEADQSFVAGLVGSSVVLREGDDPDAVGVITAVPSSSSLAVLFGTAVSASSGMVEVGEPTGMVVGHAVTLLEGQNAGRYLIASLHPTIPFQFKLKSVLPQIRDGFNQPVFTTGDITEDGVKFFSRTASLTSAIEIYDASTTFMNTAGPHSATGTTNYFKLPSLPKDLEEGDYLEFYETTLELADFERVIAQIDADGVVLLDGAIDSTSLWPFGLDSLPAVVLRIDKVTSFDAFAQSLGATPTVQQTTTFFTNLNRLVQPLLVNTNPTDADIGEVEAQLAGLAVTLEYLRVLLATYSAPSVGEADALLRTFKEKGADRAVDLLLGCQFSVFFGLTQEETSYAGNFQKGIKDVARLDMPVRKGGRLLAHQSQLKASIPSPDYETDTVDLDTSPSVDPPVTVE